VPADWSEGFCPICGAWPALAEVRGLGGSRHLRCGRCGGDWQTEWLRCPFCRENDHETVGGLVSEQGEGRHTIDVCHGCRTYVKTITTLSPMRPEDVVVHDLATVVQDLMALEHGYHRPPASERTIAVALKRRPWRLRHLLGL
jgi:FdhE protein